MEVVRPLPAKIEIDNNGSSSFRAVSDLSNFGDLSAYKALVYVSNILSRFYNTYSL